MFFIQTTRRLLKQLPSIGRVVRHKAAPPISARGRCTIFAFFSLKTASWREERKVGRKFVNFWCARRNLLICMMLRTDIDMVCNLLRPKSMCFGRECSPFALRKCHCALSKGQRLSCDSGSFAMQRAANVCRCDYCWLVFCRAEGRIRGSETLFRDFRL